MAEEFEHRDVCFRLFRALYARGLWERFWNGWLYRCYGLVSAIRHLGAYSTVVRDYLIATDRAKMDAEALARSKANDKAVKAHTRTHMLPQLLKALSPFYNPARKPAPRGLNDYLRRFEKGGDMGVAGQS